jgi:amidase
MMKLCSRLILAAAVLPLSVPSVLAAQQSAPESPAQQQMDRDLMEVTIPQLEGYYREHRYTVTQVVNWYIARIHRYNPVYGAIEDLDTRAPWPRLPAMMRPDPRTSRCGAFPS